MRMKVRVLGHFRCNMPRIPALGAVAIASLLLSSQCPLAGQEPLSHQYSIKPSEVLLPQGVALGQYRRVIQPFPNWTLICDESLKRKQRSCNVTQVIVNESGATAFSWSLAATTSGQPMMILRLPASIGVGAQASISFAGDKQVVVSKTENCDQTVCMILIPVGPVLREQMSKQSDTQVIYSNPREPDSRVVINTTFKGLPTALAAIK